MPGPPPKDRRTRRRANAPAGGEWTDLQEPDKPVLPALPRRTKKEGPWSSRTRRMWDAWRKDPATSQFGPADIAYAIETAYLAEEYARTGKVTLASELRLRLEGLGLSAKGRRNLRWRFAPPAEVTSIETARSAQQPASKRRQRAIDLKGRGIRAV